MAVVLAGGGVALGLKRAPVWTASSTLQVGRINPSSPGFYGFVQSETDLATTFSRAIDADGVLSIVDKKLNLQPTATLARLTSTPVPDGAAFRIIATGPSARAAIRLANVASAAMIQFETTANSQGNAGSIYQAYRQQSVQLQQAIGQLHRIQSAATKRVGANAASNLPSVVQAGATVAADRARATALSATYTQALESQPTGGLVAPLASALTASSDRTHKLELYGFIGLAAGLLLGGAIAVLLEQRRTRALVRR
jgi:hypothetical protein